MLLVLETRIVRYWGGTVFVLCCCVQGSLLYTVFVAWVVACCFAGGFHGFVVCLFFGPVIKTFYLVAWVLVFFSCFWKCVVLVGGILSLR